MSAQHESSIPSTAPADAAPLGILVGVDGSDQSVAAARWAQRAAARRGVPLTLVTVYSMPAAWGYAADAAAVVPDEGRLREGVEALLGDVAGRLDVDGVRPTLRVESGDAAGVLVDLSAQAELLVTGSRGRGGFLGRLLGSVSSALPAHAHCPVVIVPKDAADPRPGAPVVVGVDGSEQGRAAALVAADEALLRGAPLHLVCAVPPLGANAAWLAVTVDEQAQDRQMRELLEAGARWLVAEHPGLRVEEELVGGEPVDVLVEQSATASLTVVGTRGLGGFRGALLGSTSHGVAAHARGPVLVVPFREDVRLSRRAAHGPLHPASRA